MQEAEHSVDLEKQTAIPRQPLKSSAGVRLRPRKFVFRRQRDALKQRSKKTDLASLTICRDLICATTGLMLDRSLETHVESEGEMDEQAAGFYASILVQHFQKMCIKEVADLLALPDGTTGTIILEKLLQIATHIANTQRAGGDIRIASKSTGLVRELVKGALLDEKCLDAWDASARQLVFTIIGWTTMLYTPILDLSSLDLCVIRDGGTCVTETKTPVEVASRSMLQLLCSFGSLLPGKERQSAESNVSEDLLSRSSLCAASLYKTGEISIKWVMSCSAHLDFDETEKELSLFCIPSFCKIHRKKGTTLEYLFSEFQHSNNWSEVFTIQQFVHEILLSYCLLFGGDFRSRQNYRHTQRKRIRAVTPPSCGIDPILHQCCTSHVLEPGNVHLGSQGFSKTTDFPIFAQRLSILQQYMQKRKPSTLKGLWTNKTDINAYHTFRAVLVFGSLGVILGIIQVVSSIVQTVYSIKAYKKT